MKLALRTLGLGSFIATLPAVGILADSSAVRQAGVDFWNVPGYQKVLRSEEQSRLEMERVDRIIVERTEMKIAIAHDVVEGKMTFEEATARFVELNRVSPPPKSPAGPAFGRTDEERASCQLICHIRAMGSADACQLAEEWECTLSIPH